MYSKVLIKLLANPEWQNTLVFFFFFQTKLKEGEKKDEKEITMCLLGSLKTITYNCAQAYWN